MKVAADRSHDDLTRVQTHAHLHLDAVHRAKLLRVSVNRLLHPQRRITRAERVILECERRSEQRHDAVAHDLVYRAFVPVHGLHHPLEHWIEDLSRVFRVAIDEQFHRALQVGEEDGDLLALAFEGALRREDLLGEMPRNVGPRRRESSGLDGEGRTTRATEVLTRPHRLSAARADRLHPSAAVLAELGVVMVMSVAPRTFHAGASPRAGSRSMISRKLSVTGG